MNEIERAIARLQHERDNADAEVVRSLRELGRIAGQKKVYEKRIAKYLEERGY